MGGGQIKEASTPWNMESVYEAAAAFPSRVAQTPQKTWAILTKCKANRSFVEWSAKESFSPLEYDSIASYTAELFDSYMEYKQLLKLVENIMSNPTQYDEKTWKKNYIPIVTSTLVAVKAAFRIEMSKIVQAVDILSKDPHVLKRDTGIDAEPKNKTVREIVQQALSGGFDDQFDALSLNSEANSGATKSTAVNGEASNTALPKPAGVSEPPQTPSDASKSALSRSVTEMPPGFNPKAMIAPEIWSDLLASERSPPSSTPDGDNASKMPASLAKMFPSAPEFDMPEPAGADAGSKLEIVSAVVAFEDVTDLLQSMVKDDKLTFRASTVKSMLSDTSSKPAGFEMWMYLTLLYRYGSDGPLRLCIAKEEDSSPSSDDTTLYEINRTTPETKHPIVQPTPWNEATWSITTLVYGGKYYDDRTLISRLTTDIKTNFDKTGTRWLPNIDNGYIREDPWRRKAKTAVLFYQAKPNGKIRTTVGIEVRDHPNSRAKMTNSLEAGGTAARGSPRPSPATGLQLATTSVRTRNLAVKEQSDTVPFLVFDSGVSFFLDTGHLKVFDNGNVVSTHPNTLFAPAVTYALAAGLTGNNYTVTTEQFLSWNPNIIGLCDAATVGQYICASAPGGTYNLAAPPLGAEADAGNQQRGGPGGVVTPTTTATATLNPVSEAAGPTATQASIAPACNNYAEAKPGDGCYDFAVAHSISPSQLYQWNPILGTNGADCTKSFWASEYYCIGTATSGPAPTTSAPVTSTTQASATAPSPTQSGIVTNCNKYAKPAAGLGCYDFATGQGITPAQLYAWNAILGANGANCGTQFQAAEYYCVGVSTASTTTSFPSAITQTSGAPGPTQSGLISTCNVYLIADPGGNCVEFLTRAGISLAQLYAWNPVLGANGENCQSSFWGNEYYCVGVPAPPQPIQSGTSLKCTKYLIADPGGNCIEFASRAGIATTQLYEWNPVLGASGENCQGSFWGSEYYCVGVGS